MSLFTIYHNPRYSKSRQTLQLLQAKGVTAEVVLYLDEPPSSDDIKKLLDKLGIDARALLRKGEEAYKANHLSDPSLSHDELVAAMAAYPKLIERPIVAKGAKAVLGRPPENVLALL